MTATKNSGGHVRMMTCKFCGKRTNSIVLSTRIRNGNLVDLPEQVLDSEPCDDCKKLFDDGFRYFIGNCGHSGFVRYPALRATLSEEGIKSLGSSKIFRMEKCFMCLGVKAKGGYRYIDGEAVK